MRKDVFRYRPEREKEDFTDAKDGQMYCRAHKTEKMLQGEIMRCILNQQQVHVSHRKCFTKYFSVLTNPLKLSAPAKCNSVQSMGKILTLLVTTGVLLFTSTGPGFQLNSSTCILTLYLNPNGLPLE